MKQKIIQIAKEIFNFAFLLFQDIKNFFLDIILPTRCVACEKIYPTALCPDCGENLGLNEFQCCIVCKKPSLLGATHPGCKKAFYPEQFLCFLNYHDENVQKLIIKGKYNFIKDAYSPLGEKLGKWLLSTIPNEIKNYQVLTFIPLHKLRQNWRGFNQSEELCKSMNDILKICHANILKRIKYTKTQKDLKKEQREQNIRSAFIFQKNIDIAGKNIILVDDVATTGFTLLECAKVLKRNGSGKVLCLSLARD